MFSLSGNTTRTAHHQHVSFFQFLVEYQGRGLHKLLLRMETFFEFLERKPKIDNSGTDVAEHLQGKLELKDMSFKYPTRPESDVLKVISGVHATFTGFWPSEMAKPRT